MTKDSYIPCNPAGNYILVMFCGFRTSMKTVYAFMVKSKVINERGDRWRRLIILAR